MIACSLSVQEALGSNASDTHTHTDKHTMRHVIPMVRFTLLIKRTQHRLLRLTALQQLSLHFGGPWWASFEKGVIILAPLPRPSVLQVPCLAVCFSLGKSSFLWENHERRICDTSAPGR